MRFKLVCFDMDGVIFRDSNFWMRLHEVFGTLEQGKELTEKYLHSDYDRLVEEVVVKLWKGKDAEPYFRLIDSLEYLPGVQELFNHIHSRDYITAIISASSIDAGRRVQKDYGIDHIFANELIIKEGKVAGEFIWPIGAGRHKKAEIIRDLCSDLGISTQECIYVGDSDSDMEAFGEVGLAIAFNTESEELTKVANVIIKKADLSEVIRYIP